MGLCSNRHVGYAKLDKFCFGISGGVTPQTILDFGDGRSEYVGDRTKLSHVYDKYGTYKACLKSCDGETEVLDCVNVIVKPFVEDKIRFDLAPLSGLASVDDGEVFRVSLSSNCPPPLRVHLNVGGTISPPENELPDSPYLGCLPRHKFTVSKHKFENGIVTIDDPSKIYVNGFLVGWHDSFCFGFYDDYPSDKEIQVILERTCDECFEIDYSTCEPSSACEWSLSATDLSATELSA